MSEIEMKIKLLARLESMAKAWANGDVRQAQKDYDYIRGFCEGANLDFNNVLIGNEAGFIVVIVDLDEEPEFAAV